ncbi:MAG: hypothetical protein KIT27_09750 [Legionellales bacterium]|nr:hypothetical protein [Legionellales bacterium]
MKAWLRLVLCLIEFVVGIGISNPLYANINISPTANQLAVNAIATNKSILRSHQPSAIDETSANSTSENSATPGGDTSSDPNPENSATDPTNNLNLNPENATTNSDANSDPSSENATTNTNDNNVNNPSSSSIINNPTNPNSPTTHSTPPTQNQQSSSDQKMQHGVPKESTLAKESALEDLSKQAKSASNNDGGNVSYDNINMDTLKSVAPQCLGKKDGALANCIDNALKQIGVETKPSKNKPSVLPPSKKSTSEGQQ